MDTQRHTQKWAPVVHACTLTAEHRYIAVPIFFQDAQLKSWATRHILAARNYQDLLTNGPRLSIFQNRRCRVFGITTRAKHLVSPQSRMLADEKCPKDRMLADEKCRPIWGFFGFAARCDGAGPRIGASGPTPIVRSFARQRNRPAALRRSALLPFLRCVVMLCVKYGDMLVAAVEFRSRVTNDGESALEAPLCPGSDVNQFRTPLLPQPTGTRPATRPPPRLPRPLRLPLSQPPRPRRHRRKQRPRQRLRPARLPRRPSLRR